MRNRSLQAAVALFPIASAVLLWSAIAADDAKPVKTKGMRVRIQAAGANELSGTIAFSSIRIKGALGAIDIPTSKLRVINVSEPDELMDPPELSMPPPGRSPFQSDPAPSSPRPTPATRRSDKEKPLPSCRIMTVDGDQVAGVIVSPERLSLTTSYGDKMLAWDQVTSLTFVANAELAAGDNEADSQQAAPGANPSVRDRYRMRLAESYVVVIDSVTGHCWSRLLNGAGEWIELGKPPGAR